MNRPFLLATSAIGGLIGLSVLLGSYYSIDQGDRGVITHYGAVVGEAEPGFHLKAPFITSVTEVNMRVQGLTWDGDSHMEAYSRDQQPAGLSLTVNWHVIDPMALYSNYGSERNFTNTVLNTKTQEIVKNVFGQFDAADAIQQRAKLNAEITTQLSAALKGLPVALDSVQLSNIAFSQQYENAVEARMQAIVQEQQAEAQKAQRITNADAAAYEVKAAADAEAHKTTVTGDAEAHAIEVKGQALRQNPEIVSLTTAQAWDGKLPQTMVPGGAVPFINTHQ